MPTILGEFLQSLVIVRQELSIDHHVEAGIFSVQDEEVVEANDEVAEDVGSSPNPSPSPIGLAAPNELLGQKSPDFRTMAGRTALRLADATRVAEPHGNVVFGNMGIARDVHDHGDEDVEFDDLAAAPHRHAG
jgi:hypothetical protein